VKSPRYGRVGVNTFFGLVMHGFHAPMATPLCANHYSAHTYSIFPAPHTDMLEVLESHKASDVIVNHTLDDAIVGTCAPIAFSVNFIGDDAVTIRHEIGVEITERINYATGDGELGGKTAQISRISGPINVQNDTRKHAVLYSRINDPLTILTHAFRVYFNELS